MSCILRITDPLLKSILGKAEFKTIDELRVTFDNVANKHSILPLNINPPSKGFDIQKFGKVYKEGNEIKVQIVLPGQEYFSQFNLSNRLPEEMRDVSFYGDTDDKTLTFDSLDSFLGFYLANFLYVTDTNYTKLAKGVTTILENVVGRLEGKTFKHAGAIEDLLFADSLINYSKLLYNYAGLEEPSIVNQVYELIKDKWDKYHKNEVVQSRVKEKAEKNIETFVKSDVKANLFFQAFDYVNGKENTKPLAQARRNLIRAIQDPSKYQVKLVQGSVTQAQQTDDNGNYPTVEMIERGVVGVLIDENGNQLYLNKNNELTPNREEAISIEYEVDGVKNSSPEITLLFLNVHKALKEEFLKASPQQRETYIFKVENTKTQIEEQSFEEFSKVGKVEDILINIIADDPYAGISYLMKDGKQIIVDSTPLNEEEIQEVVDLLEHTYEPDVLEKVVAYLNDLISVSDDRVKKEKTGKEIAFFPAIDRILVMPLRIKEEDTFQSVESEPIDIRENKELILKSLRAARVRFRKGEGASLQTSWSKWKIVDGVPKSFSVKREEGIKFYENHIKKVKVDQKTSSQIATFNQRAISTKDEKPIIIGQLKVVKGKSYTIGEINQLVSPTFLEPEKTIWTTIYNSSKNTPRFIFDDYPENYPAYYDPNTNQIFVKYSQLLTNIQNEPAFLGRALTEELLHAITVPLLNQYKDTVEYQRLQEDYQRVKELAKTYKDTENYNKLTQSQKNKMDMIVNYYLQSFEEFVVGISHPYFRSFLTLGESKGLLEDIIAKVKKLLNKILKDVSPSLYTDVTTDLFNFIVKKPTELTPIVIEQTQISTAPESTSSVTFLQESLDLKIWKEIVDSGKYFTLDESDKERPIQYSDNPVGLYLFTESGEETYSEVKSEVFDNIIYADDKEYTEILSVQNLLDELEEATSPNERLRLITYLKRLNKYLPGYFNYYLNQIQADNKFQKEIYNKSTVEQIFNFSYLPGTQGAERVYTINYDNNLIGYAAIDNGNQIRWITIRDQYEGMGLATKLINEIRKDDPKVKFKITLINNPQIFKISERLEGKKISETSVELPSFTAKPIELEFVQRETFVPQQARLFESEITLKKREKKSTQSKEIKKYYTIPTISEEVDLTLIQGIDAEIGKTLFSSGAFADFVQKNVETESVWQRMVNDLKEEYNELVDASSTQENEDRLDWIDLFLENEMEYKRQWIEKSNLFVFNNDKIVINEDEVGDEELAETSDEMESKDPGYNRVDSEQTKTRLQLGDPYAKILVKLTPVGRVKGLTQLADFTNLWNRLQNLLVNTINFDEQLKILSNTDNLMIVPEAPILVERLESMPKDVNGAIIINNFQRSFGTALIPVYNTYFTKTDKGYDYSFFESAKLDVQNLEMLINQGFNEFAEPWKTTVRLGDREIPTYDLKQFLTLLEKSKDLIETYRKLGFPIPDMNKDRFIRESGLTNFHAGLIQIIKNRIGKWNGGESKNTVVLNGDLLAFIKSPATWVEFGNNIGTSPGLATLTNKFTSALAKYSPLTVSNMTKNAENQNQSILLSWSSWLISVKQLNDGESYRMKNPIFKYSLLSQLVDTDNQITPINLTGQRIQDGTGWDGTVSMSQNFIDYVRQEISNMMLSGTGEILRAETKQSSFGYKFKWGNSIHPIKLENFKTDKWISDVSDIYIGNKNEDVLKGYLKGELERIEIEKNNPVIYYPKYERIKGDFHLFTFLSKELKENITSLSPQEAVDKYRNEIKEELINHFNNLVNELKQEVFNQTGIPLTANHPILNVTQIQQQIKALGFENFLGAFIVNRDIYQTEHFITGHGDVGQHDKPYKRFGSNISTGTPSELNEITKQVLENTKHKQFRERIPTGKSFVISDDIFSYDNPKLVDDIEKSLTESYKRFGLDKTPKEIREEAVKKATPYRLDPTNKRAKGINVADGQGFMTPDFGRLVMIATGTWTNDREKGFWFQKIQHKRNKGIPLEAREQEHYDKVNEEIKERGIFWFFPPLKLQYRGEFIPNNETNVAIEGLDKFSLAWLWPDEMEGRVFEPILNKMMDEGYDYGKFESGTKIGTFKPDNLLQEIRNGNVDVTIESGHDIDLTYMKEQVRAADKFKDKMPMSTQARKLVLSNLRFNGEYLNDSIGEAATEWKQSQAEISEENVLDLMDRISTNGEIDNKKLAEEIKEELKKRELPQSLTSIFILYGDEFYQRFEQSLSPQLVETLIYSLLKNKVVRPKFPGEHYIMMSSSLFDREGRELGFYELGNSVIKNGVDFVFEQNPELYLVGTKEEYSQYLDTIFPDSKVKDIVYHGSPVKFDMFSKEMLGNRTQALSAKQGFFFASNKENTEIYKQTPSKTAIFFNSLNVESFNEEEKLIIKDIKKYTLFSKGEIVEKNFKKWLEKEDLEDPNFQRKLLINTVEKYKRLKPTTYSVILNITNPSIYSDNKSEYRADTYYNRIEESKDSAKDSVVIKETKDPLDTDIFVVFEPEQIHILGSKQDVSGFKKWKQSLPQVVETTKPAQCKVVLSGEFLKLLNVKEITDYINSPEVKPVYEQLSPYEQIENKRELLNQLLLNPIFVEKYKDSLTVFSSRIPGQGYNSMDIMTIQEFLPTYMGAVLVPYAQMTTKVGADFDFDKIPTITPELTKTGKAKDSKVNRMLNAASRLILDPLNFHRLVTPNTTEEIDQVVSNTLEALGENVSEPRFDKIFSFTTHLRKWMATKMKDALGIGATNNTFYTLLQDADAKLYSTFQITDGLVVDVKFPFERDEQAMSYPLLQSGIDKLEFVNEFINITVDVASNDAIGYTGLKRDNSALLLFLLENGVDFADAFYFINQPIVIKYHQLLNQFKDQGYTTGESKNLAISKLLGIQTEADGKTIPKSIIYDQIDKKITKEKFSNLLSTIARKDEVDKKWNTATQKEYLAYYLIGLEMTNKMREAQSYNNFDTSPSPNLLYSEARENTINQINDSGLFFVTGIQKIHNDSVISHLNVHDEFKRISEIAFKIKRDPRFTTQSLGLSEYIYDPNDKENFFKKFDNDYLLAILQNFGTISKEKVEKNLRGELIEKWNKVKKLDEVKDLTISKYVVTNYSTKTPYTSLTLFLGLDGDSLTLDQIAKDLRVMLNSPNKEVKEFAKDFIETGLYATGFTQSPVYYLKALPFEVINGYLKEAYDNFEKLSNSEKEQFIELFSDRFLFQRGMQFGQYWITLYKKVFNIKNLDFQTKQLQFNQEAWRYTDYKLSLEELNRPESKPVSVTTYQGRITKLGDNEVFVFGSNPLGINGNPSKGTGGAALVAHNIAGVKQGEKMDNRLSDSGKAWGITTVTKPGAKRSKTPDEIKQGIKKLYDYANKNPDKRFLIAYQGKTGSNLNGYTNQELADMFSSFSIPSNVIFEKDFSTLLNQPDITDMNQPVTFQEHSSPNYQGRTGINAQADATIAFAVNFNSRGELRTKEEVTKKGKKYIPIDAKNKTVTPELVQRVVNELRSVNAKTLNIAGNGIYEPGIGTQQEVDDFVFNLLEQVIAQYPIQSIRTGGQTGYDEAGAKAGIRLGIPTIVLAPKGWKFRDKSGTDISSEQQFKERFNVQPRPKQLDLFEQKDCDLDVPF